MRKSRLYLETSTWNFYFADDAPEKRDVTISFFQRIKDKKFDIFISDVVVREIDMANDEKRSRLFTLVEECIPERLPVTEDVIDLAKRYLLENALPGNKFEDALHAAAATVFEMDALISWNLKHLANLRRIELINGINLKSGFFKRLQITTPWEVSDDSL